MTGSSGAAWKRSGMYVEPQNARQVMAVLGAIGVFSAGQRFAWRGMSSADFELRSSLHRRLGPQVREARLREVEKELLDRARRWGLGVMESGHVDDLQLLANLQHFGVPTRLIDFTSNPMTALWFACQEPSEANVARSGLLLALDVARWPVLESVAVPSGATWGSVGDPTGFALENALATTQPFVVRVTVANERLKAQEGFFVAGALPPGGLAEVVRRGPFASLDIAAANGDATDLEVKLLAERGRGRPSALPYVAVVIKAGLKKKLLRYLGGTYNRTASVLFPDYAGFRDFGAKIEPVRHSVPTAP